MSDEYRTYSVLVTRTERLQVHVMARDDADARKRAQDMALRSRFATTQLGAEISASWPHGEDEEGPTVSDEPGYAWRRGWFYVASLDFEGVAMTAEDLFSRNPDVDASNQRALGKAFVPFIHAHSTVFHVTRRYGFAVRLDGDVLWSEPCPDEREARRAGRRAVNHRVSQAKVAAYIDLVNEVKQRMMAPGEAHSLFKTKGGRWSVKSVIGDTTNPGEITLPDDAWFVDIKMVKTLLAMEHVKVDLAYEKSGAPLAVSLTDAVLRPF